ncbi:TetR/AcrR family transcriptional regulator [Isoptericola jiangsuensis]|uniref:TetR/AcrR family transcriptional regulator n=1 Tax=Isoptericola jiangsuensis TaxID=548579 RepID=UPI003AACF0FA
MDARQQRTRTHLRSAILDLAALRPVGGLSVAEVARAAGITRDTFYRHCTGPVELLAGVLAEELDRIELGPGGSADEFLDAVTRLLEHVATHAPVYQGALLRSTEGAIRDVLHDVVAERLDAFLRAVPDALPHVPAGLPDDDATRAVVVAYCAAGTVAAITVWLHRDADRSEIPGMARTILAAGPRWWLRESGASA